MDRIAIPVRTSDSGTGFLDQSADERFTASNRTGDSAYRPCRTQSVLSEPEDTPDEPEAANDNEEPLTEEVSPRQIWFQLSASERQRFGHCFSIMVLKALELRCKQVKEVE